MTSSILSSGSYWVKIRDPDSGDLFYAHPETGECTWDLKPNMNVMDVGNTEVWWQLFDEQHQLPYYYNTNTQITQWLAPSSSLIVNLINIQKHAVGKKVSRNVQLEHPPSFINDTRLMTNDQTVDKVRSISSLDDIVETNLYGIPNAGSGAAADSYFGHYRASTDPAANDSMPITIAALISPVLPNVYLNTPGFDPPSQSDDQSTTTPSPSTPFVLTRASPLASSPASLPPMESVNGSVIGNSPYTMLPTSGVSKLSRNSFVGGVSQSAGDLSTNNTNPSCNIVKHSTISRSSGRNYIPANLKKDLAQFQIDGFAKKFFATQKRGLFRRRVPLEKLLEWAKDTLNLPLMVISKARHKDALKSYKVIQGIMGDRTRAKSIDDRNEIRWLLEKGVQFGEMRDEMYVQLCKQLTHNPGPISIRKGWEIMACLTSTFPPSKHFEDYLKSFISAHADTNSIQCKALSHPTNPISDDIVTLSEHCARRLDRACKNGPRGKAPPILEIERMMQAAFLPSVFGETLEHILSLQHKKYPNLKYPRILVFLSQAILKLNGCQAEGIFRVPGDADMITNLRLKLENYDYSIDGISDPNVPAGLLKFWLRELAEPLIPESVYAQCITNCESTTHALEIIEQLPKYNQRVAQYMIKFLQIFALPENQTKSKMTVQNLAMVFAPNFLRCPSDNPSHIFENTKYEQMFLRHLIQSAQYPINILEEAWS